MQFGKRGLWSEKKTCRFTSTTFDKGSTETTKRNKEKTLKANMTLNPGECQAQLLELSIYVRNFRRWQHRNDKSSRWNEQKKVESKLKTHSPGECQARFPELEMKSISDLEDSFTGAIVGRDLCHAWFDVDYIEKTVYDEKVEKWKGMKWTTYKIAYWILSERNADEIPCPNLVQI